MLAGLGFMLGETGSCHKPGLIAQQIGEGGCTVRCLANPSDLAAAMVWIKDIAKVHSARCQWHASHMRRDGNLGRMKYHWKLIHSSYIMLKAKQGSPKELKPQRHKSQVRKMLLRGFHVGSGWLLPVMPLSLQGSPCLSLKLRLIYSTRSFVGRVGEGNEMDYRP